MPEDKSRRDRWVTRAEDLSFVALTPEAEEKAKRALRKKKEERDRKFEARN